MRAQQVSDRSAHSIHVRHLPPGTSKWNKIEHRLFSYISTNWRGRLLTSLATILNLLASTRTRTGLSLSVVHFPPATSKWNKIKHRLFSHSSANWRGRPLTSLAVIINLIASTRTQTGLRVRAELDTGKYPLGVEVPEEGLATIRLRRHRVHGEWNYTIRPRR